MQESGKIADIQRLRAQGKSLSEIGEELGVSKQRVSQLLGPSPGDRGGRPEGEVGKEIRLFFPDPMHGAIKRKGREWAQRILLEAYALGK